MKLNFAFKFLDHEISNSLKTAIANHSPSKIQLKITEKKREWEILNNLFWPIPNRWWVTHWNCIEVLWVYTRNVSFFQVRLWMRVVRWEFKSWVFRTQTARWYYWYSHTTHRNTQEPLQSIPSIWYSHHLKNTIIYSQVQ